MVNLLIQYTIEAAREIFLDENIIVSTDDRLIKNTVENIGLEVPFLRPKELATDTSGSTEVLLHALDFMKSKGKIYDTVLLLQPTSPFRTSQHIIEAVKLYEKEKPEMVVSVKETKANPYYVLREDNTDGFLEPSKQGKFTRRQDCPKVWELNGAIYVINIRCLLKKKFSDFKKVIKYVMDEKTSVDIDDEIDWTLAEILASKLDN